MLRDMNITVWALYECKVEVLASGLPLNHESQLAVDITLRSALTTSGTAPAREARVDGVGFTQARRDIEEKYHELREHRCCQEAVKFFCSRWQQHVLAIPCDAALIIPLMETSTDTHVGSFVLPSVRKFCDIVF